MNLYDSFPHIPLQSKAKNKNPSRCHHTPLWLIWSQTAARYQMQCQTSPWFKVHRLQRGCKLRTPQNLRAKNSFGGGSWRWFPLSHWIHVWYIYLYLGYRHPNHRNWGLVFPPFKLKHTSKHRTTWGVWMSKVIKHNKLYLNVNVDMQASLRVQQNHGTGQRFWIYPTKLTWHWKITYTRKIRSGWFFPLSFVGFNGFSREIWLCRGELLVFDW